MYSPELLRVLIEEEGWSNRAYVDTTGHTTIGIGHNLSDVPISDAAVLVIFADDILAAERSLDAVFGPGWRHYGSARRIALINMMFNLGQNGFLKFGRMIGAIKRGEWTLAALELKDSRYFETHSGRVGRIAHAFAHGEILHKSDSRLVLAK